MKTDLKAILMSFGPLLVIAILFVFVAKYAMGKISEVRGKILTERKNETVLQQRLNLLTEVEGDVLSSSDISLSALPEANPSLMVITQLKSLAAESGITLTNIKSGGGTSDKSNIKRVDVAFDATGARPLIMQFLQRVGTVAPISLIDKVKLNETGGVTRATVTVKSFWADLPTKLPPLDAALPGLTAAEESTLTDVLTLTQPVFLEVTPSETGGREDPFNP